MTQEQIYHNLYRRVRNAHIRYCGFSFYFYFMRSFFYCLITACLAGGGMKLLPWDTEPYEGLISIGILGLSLPIALFFTWKRRGSLKTTAMLTDKHLHLKEKISSALELGILNDVPNQEKEWNSIVLRDALRSAERLNLQKAFPLTNPRELRWIWVPTLVLLITLFILPQWDYLSGNNQTIANADNREEIRKEMQKLMQRQLVIERKSKEKDAKIASEISKQIKDLAADLSKGKIEKRDALSKLSSLEEEFEKRKEQMESMKSAMEEPLSKGMKPKMTSELVEAMEENNFEKAVEAMAKLQKQLKLGNLDEQGKKQLAEEMQKMASLMNMDTPLAKALQNAGEMLQASELGESLQSMQMAEMNLADMENLMEQMALIQDALKDLKDCKMALSGKNGEGEGFGEGEMAGMFGKGSGDGEGWGPESVSPWQPGESRARGNGMGGPGIGRGANAPNEKTATQLTPDKLKGMFGDAPIQAMLPVDGASIKTDTIMGADMSAGFEYTQESEKALAKERVPLPLRHQVRLYFDTKPDAAGTSSSSAGDSANTASSSAQTGGQ